MIRHFTLHRLTHDDTPTFGWLADEEERELARTLEPPWLDNAKDVSCIPAGTYPCHRVLSPKRGYEVFMLDGVPGRDSVEIHIGNFVHDTEGCVLLGEGTGIVNGQHAITGSKDAFARFMTPLAGQQNCLLTILDPE